MVVPLLVAGLAWGLSSALADSGSPAPAATQPGEKVTLRLGLMNVPDSLNPFVGYENSAYEVWCLNYDFLVAYAPDGSPRPAIAESWSTSPDGKTWIFKIRKGVTWQDGKPLTARDVAFTYNYIVKKKLGAYNSYTKLIDYAEATDDYTCEVHCTKPKANMLRLYIYVFPEHIWSKIDNPEKYQMTYPIIGSGPFKTIEYKTSRYTRLVKNPDYWGGEPTVDEIIFEYYTNNDSMVQEFKNGKLDGAYDIPAAQFPALTKTSGVETFESNVWSFEYLTFNCYDEPASLGNPVLKDVKFRQALNWAVDREKLVQVGLSGYGRPGSTVCPPDEYPTSWNAHYEPSPEQKYGFDIEKAKQLLDAAGYVDSDGNGMREDKNGKPITLRLWARNETISSQREGKLLADWFSQCGLKIDFDVVDDGVLDAKLYNYNDAGAYAPDYDMYLWDFVGYADPGDSLACFVTDQIEWWNDPCWSNEEYDTVMDQQMGELDPQARLEMIHRLQEIFYVESPYIVLTYPNNLSVVDTSRWEGWVPFMGSSPFYNAFNIDSYVKLHPLVKTTGTTESKSNTTLYIIIGAIAAAVIVVVVLVLVLRKPKVVEE
jgi:peptide/nickel transport system substrate-binding protein